MSSEPSRWTEGAPEMKGPGTSAILAVVNYFVAALQARKAERLSVFDGLVQKNYDKLRTVHQEFHSLLWPIDAELARIEQALIQGAEPWCAIDRLHTTLREHAETRHHGQPDRHALYQHCVALDRSRTAGPRMGTALSADEWMVVRQFIGTICGYFHSNHTYGHDFGNVLGWIVTTTEMWGLKGGASIQDVQYVRMELQGAARRMTEKWATVCENFTRVEAVLRYNLKFPDTPLERGTTEILAIPDLIDARNNAPSAPVLRTAIAR